MHVSFDGWIYRRIDSRAKPGQWLRMNLDGIYSSVHKSVQDLSAKLRNKGSIPAISLDNRGESGKIVKFETKQNWCSDATAFSFRGMSHLFF